MAKPHHGYKETHITHHEDGSHTMHHVHHEDSAKDIGTRYFPLDKFGERLKIMDGPDGVPMKYLKRAAWTVKPEFSQVPMLELKEHMVDLYFPEKINFSSVMAKLRRDFVEAMCQQFNEPVGGEDLVHFDEVVMRAHHLSGEPADLVNQPTYITWDCSSG